MTSSGILPLFEGWWIPEERHASRISNSTCGFDGFPDAFGDLRTASMSTFSPALVTARSWVAVTSVARALTDGPKLR